MTTTYTLDEQIAELRRELGHRPRVFSRWVSDGRMTQQQADERMGRLQAAVKTLEGLRDEQRAKVYAAPSPATPPTAQPVEVPLDGESEERRAFEVHAPMNTSRRGDFPGVYDDAFVQSAWAGWQARARGTPAQWIAAQEGRGTASTSGLWN